MVYLDLFDMYHHWQAIPFIFLSLTSSSSSSSLQSITEGMTPSTKRPPIELHEIGYNGTWEMFCDRTQIDKEFTLYFEHDLKTIRLLICKLKENNLISRDSLLAFASYKYCLMMRHRFDELLDEFVIQLSHGEREKKLTLLTPGPVNVTKCYNDTLPAFNRHCAGNGNPCYKLFRLIMGRACFASWLSTENILSSIEKICAGKYITDNINWDAVLMTINYRND